MKENKIVTTYEFMSMLLMIGLVACSDESSNQNDDEESLKEINVMLDWYPNAVHSFLYVMLLIKKNSGLLSEIRKVSLLKIS